MGCHHSAACTVACVAGAVHSGHVSTALPKPNCLALKLIDSVQNMKVKVLVVAAILLLLIIIFCSFCFGGGNNCI